MRPVTTCCARHRKLPARDRIPKRLDQEKFERHEGQDRDSVSVNVKLTLRAESSYVCGSGRRMNI